MAARQGNASAQVSLAAFYMIGEGVDQDVDKAIEWCQKAASQGFEPAIRLRQQIKNDTGR